MFTLLKFERLVFYNLSLFLKIGIPVVAISGLVGGVFFAKDHGGFEESKIEYARYTQYKSK